MARLIDIEKKTIHIYLLILSSVAYDLGDDKVGWSKKLYKTLPCSTVFTYHMSIQNVSSSRLNNRLQSVNGLCQLLCHRQVSILHKDANESICVTKLDKKLSSVDDQGQIVHVSILANPNPPLRG